MKKTIAILLVLVIAGAGVFAATNGANATMAITTTVTGLNYIVITDSALPENTNTMALFNSATSTPKTTAAIPEISSTIGHLNLLTNARTGVAVYMKSSKLGSLENSATNAYQIDVTVSVAGDTYLTSEVPETNNGFVQILTATETASPAGLYINTYPITANTIPTSFENAPVDNYTGTLTIAFTTV